MKSTFTQLLSRLKAYKASVIASIVCNVLMTVFTVISIPILIPFFQLLFDRDTANTDSASGKMQVLTDFFAQIIKQFDKETALILVCVGLAISIFLKNLFRYLALYFMTPVRTGIVANLRSELYAKYLALPVDYFNDAKKGGLITRLISDVMEVEFSILQFIEAVFKDPLLIIGSIGFMLYINPWLTMFVFLLMIVSGVVISTVTRKLRAESTQVQETLGNITSTLDESITGMAVIKAYNVQAVWQEKFESYNQKYKGLITGLLRRRDMSSPMSEFLGVTVVTIVLYYGSHLVFQNAITPEVFFAFIFAFYNVIEPSKSLANTYFNVQKGMAAMERIQNIFDEEAEQDSVELERNETQHVFNSSIRFENVSFRYNDKSGNALESINLTISKGEKIALVGSSGSGKSTFMKLLLKFYKPSSGAILLDNIDVGDIPNAALRKQIGWVTQEAFLFNGTVGENIQFGRPEFNHLAIAKAAEMAYAKDFVEVLSNGFGSPVGERGNKFSGGEKQRISIARAMLGNPPILLLDEPTSALDPDAERRVTDALKTAMQGRTSIVIAHRMSTIMNVDRIIVMHEGRIVGVGSHEELLVSNAIYKHYISLQNRNHQ